MSVEAKQVPIQAIKLNNLNFFNYHLLSLGQIITNGDLYFLLWIILTKWWSDLHWSEAYRQKWSFWSKCTDLICLYNVYQTSGSGKIQISTDFWIVGSWKFDKILFFWLKINWGWSNILSFGFVSSDVDPIFSFWILIKSSWLSRVCINRP